MATPRTPLATWEVTRFWRRLPLVLHASLARNCLFVTWWEQHDTIKRYKEKKRKKHVYVSRIRLVMYSFTGSVLTFILASCRNSSLTSVYQLKTRITLAIEAWILSAARLASLTMFSLWRVSTNAKHTPFPWVSSWNTWQVQLYSLKEQKD